MPHLTASSSAIISFCSVAVVCIFREKWKRQIPGSESNDISISLRGKSLLTPTLPYIIDYLKCLQDHCDPYTNPKVSSVYTCDLMHLYYNILCYLSDLFSFADNNVVVLMFFLLTISYHIIYLLIGLYPLMYVRK